MKAIQVTQYGGSEVLSVVDLPTPQLKSTEILIDMKVTGYNFHFGCNPQRYLSRSAHSSAVCFGCRRSGCSCRNWFRRNPSQSRRSRFL